MWRTADRADAGAGRGRERPGVGSYLPLGLGARTPEAFASDLVGAMERYSDFRLLSWGQSRALGTTTDASGRTWQLQSFDYEATYGLAPLHGVMTVAVANYEFGYPRPQSYHSGMIWTREVVVPEWDRLAAITAVVQSYVRVVAGRSGSGVRSPVTNAPDYGDDVTEVWDRWSASTDATSREWEEAILGFETCVQPSTGEEVYMPYSTYYPGGVGGGPGGYYLRRPDGGYEHTPVLE